MSATPLPPASPFVALLRGHQTSSPAPHAWNDPALFEAARGQGLLPLVIDRLRQQGWRGITDERREALEKERHAAIALAMVSTLDLTRVLAALQAAGVHALVIKGAALAHAHYAAPWLRPRLDTDLLIRRADVDAAHAAFRALGATYVPHVTGEYVMSQFHYQRSDAAGCRHLYDVHWRVANPVAFADTLSYEDMAESAATIPALGHGAQGPAPVHALLLAAVHRAAHHGGEGPLVWAFDVHLLAESLDEDACRQLADEAMSRRIGTVTAAAAAAAHAAFGGGKTALLAHLLADAPHGEPSARFLSRRSRATEGFDELRSLTGNRRRLRLVREWLLPSAGYMRETYAPGSSWPLPVLYVMRAARGAVRWCRPRSSGSDPGRSG